MRPVLPGRDDPLIEKLLQFQQRPRRLPLGMAPPALNTGSAVSGDELGEQRGHLPEHPLDAALLPARPLVGGLEVDAQEIHRRPWKLREMNTFP